MSQPDARTLRILCVMDKTDEARSRSVELCASEIARQAWPRLGGPVGRRAGQWQSMGRVLAGMARRGLCFSRFTDHGQKLWTISREGREAVEAMPSPASCCTCRKPLGAARRVDTFRVHAWHPACDDTKCEVAEHQP